MKTDLQDIINTTITANAGRPAENIKASSALRDRLVANLPAPKPLTKLERLRRRLQDARDALRVMRGEASYIEWYDDDE